ncbi:CPBP family intramembrane glutamic endopeptidase [Halobacillus litoralis]|uniref:CPBP family intramembrane glutamic endopeptidase n=1 Tax=Halobacillus litoralis TaxID=45668 RepID=UPI001CFEDDE8|nr:type II CAAX endopeptidase family protein [Halobacillus litoralis]
MNQRNRTDRAFYEMVVIAGLMLLSVLFVPSALGLLSILPIIYVFVERRVRHRTKESIGFKRKRLYQDLLSVLPTFLLVSFALPVAYFFIFTYSSPALLEHIEKRVDILSAFNGAWPLAILLFALGEEIVFRGLIQARLNWKMRPAYAIVLSSILFSVMHLTEGSSVVVTVDLATIFLDSILFGCLFFRTNNLYISWLAHALANLTGAFLLFFFL